MATKRLKPCPICGEPKDYDDVNQKYICKPCKSEYAKKWRAANPIRVRMRNNGELEREKESAQIKEIMLIDPRKLRAL